MLILCTFVNTMSIVPKCSISGQHQAQSSGCGASKHEDKLGTRHLHYTEEKKNIERIENRKNGWMVLKKRERVWAMCKPQKIMERKSEWCKRRRLGKRQGKSIWSDEHQKKRKSNGVCVEAIAEMASQEVSGSCPTVASPPSSSSSSSSSSPAVCLGPRS